MCFDDECLCFSASYVIVFPTPLPPQMDRISFMCRWERLLAQWDLRDREQSLMLRDDPAVCVAGQVSSALRLSTFRILRSGLSDHLVPLSPS